MEKEYLAKLQKIDKEQKSGELQRSTAARRAELVNAIIRKTHLDYRTITALSQTPEEAYEQWDIPQETLADPLWYSASHCLNMLCRGYDFMPFIPIRYFQDERFLEAAGITELPDGFVRGDTGLTSFRVRPQIRKIGKEAFAGCTSLIVVEYACDANQLESIGDFAFADDRNLSVVLLPNSVQKLGRGAFKGCDKLDYVMFDARDKAHKDRCFILYKQKLLEEPA